MGVTGSIAAYKSADILRGLQEKGLAVSVIMTREAEHFLTPLTLSSLCAGKIYRGMFEKDSHPEEMPHIRLAEDAYALLIAPATANIIAKLAHGFADDLLTCTILGTKAPVLIAPAMNTEMYKNKVVQENCERLKNLGFHFISPKFGKLACGTVGEGHIADEETIIKTVLRILK